VKTVLVYVVCVSACLAAGALGSLFTRESVETWYPTLRKPAWTPPAWLFGPVWTALYAAMGVAAGRVWTRAEGSRRALALFAVQLALNAGWSWVFFGLRRPGLAFAEIVALILMALATALAFRRHSRLAFALLLPYLAWLIFAAALNFAIWRLNG